MLFNIINIWVSDLMVYYQISDKCAHKNAIDNSVLKYELPDVIITLEPIG